MTVNVAAASESVREAITPEFVAKVIAMVDDELKGMLPPHLKHGGRNQALGDILATAMAEAYESLKPADPIQRAVLMQMVALSGSMGVRNQFLAKFDERGDRKP